jgi:HEAT repeat protein
MAVRRLAAESLGRIGNERAVEPLTQALNDEDRKVRREAKKALKKLQKALQPNR